MRSLETWGLVVIYRIGKVQGETRQHKSRGKVCSDPSWEENNQQVTECPDAIIMVISRPRNLRQQDLAEYVKSIAPAPEDNGFLLPDNFYEWELE